MSNQINTNILKNFIIKTIGSDKLTQNQAQKYDVDNDEYNEANVDENNYLDIDEILDNDELYDKFATLFVEDREKRAEEKDAEKEKEEETKVKDKNQAGV